MQGGIDRAGWDKLIPFLYRDDKLEEDNVGFILIKDNNNPSITLSQAGPLFDLMDPFKLGLFNKDNTSVPIIRLVFSMAREVPKMQQYVPELEDDNLPPQFTSFDFVCEGLSSEVFPVIQGQDDADGWKYALCMTPLKKLMEAQELIGAKRMYPLSGMGYSLVVTESDTGSPSM